MKLILEGTQKEIADLVLRIQSQPKINSTEVAKILTNDFIQAFAATHGTCGEYCVQKSQ
ncbi:MAG: hypothetical protein HFE49_00075 [Clostridia bacterium]|nr:hypothetical protein [Clostridia bacterium]